MARIGLAGLGRMGAAMAERLLDQGHTLAVWNRSADKAKPLVARGATLAATPAALAAQSDVIITIVSDAAALEQVFGGAEGVLATDLAGKTVLEMSTVRPEAQQALAERVRARGGAYVECPVGGTTGPARQGKLLGLAGGEAADIARLKPVFDDLCRRVEHVGPVGAGASMKLAINLPLMLYYQALGEALTLCQHLGHDPLWLMELFSDTSGGPNVLKNRGPAIATALQGGEPSPPTFDVDLCIKDLRTMLEEAKAHGRDLPLVSRALEVYGEAAKAGWGMRDGSVLPSWWPKHAK
jgi:3-hydroxyisobutyrate dehydrogenase